MKISMYFKLVSPVLLLLIVLSSSCTFKAPGKPYWNVTYEIPLVSKRYTMRDIAKDVDEISVDEQAEQVILSLDKDIETFEVGDRLQVSQFEREINLPVGGSLTDSLAVPNDLVVVDTAVIKQGQVTIRLENRTSQNANVSFLLSDLIDQFGNPFSFNESIPAGVGEVVFTTQDLAGFKFIPPIRNGQNFLRFTASTSGGSGGEIRTRISISDLVFSRISGVLNELELPLEDMEAELNIPEAFKDFEINSADLRLVVDVGIEFPIDVDILVEGHDTDDGSTPTIHIQKLIQPVPGKVDTITINGVANFVNSHPEKIEASGRVLVGDGVKWASVDDNDVVKARGFLVMPFILKIPSYSTKMDVDTLELDEDTRDILRDNLTSASMQADVINGLPLGMTLTAVFSSSITDSTIYDPGAADVTLELALAPAPNDGGNPAVVTGSTPSSLLLDLDETKLAFFESHETVYWGIKFDFPGTAQQVRFRPQDFIEMNAKITAQVSTKIPEDDE